MQIVTTMISFVKDVKDKDKDLRNLNTQLSYVLYKARQLNQKCICENPVHSFSNSIISRATEMSNKLSQLFKQQNISIKEKVKLSFPLDKTKDQLKQLIEALDKVSAQLKEHTQQKVDKQSLPIETRGPKRKLNTTISLVPENIIRQISSHSVQEDQQIDEMGPTLQNNEIIEMINQKILQVKILIEVQGDQKILESIFKKSPDLLKYQKTVNIENKPQIQLFTLCRLYFKNVYKQLKAVFPDIDRISKQKHFNIIWRRTKISNSPSNTQQAKQQSQINENLIPGSHNSEKKMMSLSKISGKKSQRANQQFLSFPQQNFGIQENLLKGSIFLIRQENKTSYLRNRNFEWQKCDEYQVQLKNGDCITPIVVKKGDELTAPLYIQIGYSLPQ